MEDFSVLLILLGFLGVCISIVLLIIKLVFRRSWKVKRIMSMAGIAFAMFVLGGILLPPLHDQTITSQERETEQEHNGTMTVQENSQKEQELQEEQTDKEKEDDKEQKTQEEQAMQKELEEQEKQEEQGEPIIPGLTAADVKLNLERVWGFKFSGPRIGQELIQDNGKKIDPDTGITLLCNIFETSPMHVQWVDFVIDASLVAGIIRVDTINALAEGYFGYCATVPYEGAEPEKAKQWVEENVKKIIEAGNVISTQIGPVTFEMFGTEYFRTLRIKPATQ